MSLRSKQTDVLETQLAEARKRIAELESELAQTATRDPLTESLLTPRAFRAQLMLDVMRAHRYQRPLGLVIIDIDGFRAINSEHGYGAGDGVLVALARVISETTRAHDVASRMGGDEFAILLPEAGSEAALQAGERILHELENLTADPIRGLSVSVGVASLRPDWSPEGSSERLLACARTALELARAGGGGRAVVYTNDEEAGEVAPDPAHGS